MKKNNLEQDNSEKNLQKIGVNSRAEIEKNSPLGRLSRRKRRFFLR